ncbi:ATP-binding cassette domain-containing protein, partial [Escherichia coli]|uniref:ATP-binding cassette domain-containing protein n=1 Tax=Escherichia coli TaxID=562 RepID=UPI00227FC283
VKRVNFSIGEGEVFGLVGESGSGKSTVARLISGLYTPSGGSVTFGGTDLTALKGEKQLNPFRRQIQMIFQDPQASLNPRQRLRQILGESLKVHKLAPSAEIPARIDQA